MTTYVYDALHWGIEITKKILISENIECLFKFKQDFVC